MELYHLVIAYPERSSHPGSNVNAYRWIADGKMEVEGMGGQASVNLPAGLHQIILVAEDQAETQDRDTMKVDGRPQARRGALGSIALHQVVRSGARSWTATALAATGTTPAGRQHTSLLVRQDHLAIRLILSGHEAIEVDAGR